MSQPIEVSFVDYAAAAVTYKQAQIRCHKVDDVLYCYLSEGPIELLTKLTEPADIVRFAMNFGPRSEKDMVTKNSILTSSEGASFVSISTDWIENPLAAPTFSVILPEPTYLLGGTIIVANALPGDSMTFEVLHPQAGVVGVYLKNFLLPQGNSQTVIREAAKLLPAGLILRATYNSVSSQQNFACWGVNYTAYRSEARK
jgi:hypothetical protein